MSAVRRSLGQVIRFGIVGGAATVAHLGVASLLLHTAPWINLLMINGIAFVCAFPVSLFGHSMFTFRAELHAARLFGISVSGFLLNTFILASIVRWTQVTGFPAILLTTVLVPLASFTMTKMWAIRESL